MLKWITRRKEKAMMLKHSKRTLRTPCPDCGATNLYYAHDTKAGPGEWCEDCGDDSRLVLVHTDLTPHVCSAPSIPKESPVPAPVAPADPFATAPTAVAAPAPVADDKAAAALAAIRELMGPTEAVDRAEVERITREIIGEMVFPTKTVVVRDNVTRELEGLTHERVADVTTVLLSGEHVMMVGPAGTGKSTIAEQAAEALGLASYSISLSPQTPASQIIGYMQATGEYVGTLFRKAYEHGGLFHFDEVDNAHPSVLALINGALANGHMAFPDGMVKRHEDFRAAASANTYGRGATRAYVGRQAIDAATLDRFTVLTIEIDQALERSLCLASGADELTADRVLGYVRGVRDKVNEHGLTVVVSPRASVGMCRLVAAGMSWDTAVDARVRRGLDDATWSKIS